MSAPRETRSRPGGTLRDERGPTNGPPGVQPSFTFAYTGIRVRDIADSIRFYTEVMGMEVVEPLQSTPPTNGKVATLRSPGSSQSLELNWYEPGSRFAPLYSTGEELDHLAFECDDVRATVSALERRGVEVLFRPKEIGGELGWNEAFVKDPNGIWIELLPRKRKE
jgi:lactoylglutathione lyase